MRLRRTWCAIVGLAAVAGCSRQETLPCEPEPRYSAARSAQPVQVPDDLSPPNESDALRLPADPGGASITAGDCLEEPPSFFGESRPFEVTEEPDRESRREARRQRREARRAESAEAPAAQPEPTPAEPSEPAPPGDDRVIDN